MVSAGVDGDPVAVLYGLGDVGVGAAGAVATGGDAIVVDPEGKVGVGPAVGGAGDPEIAAADPAVGQRSKVIEEGVRGLGMGRYTGCHPVSERAARGCQTAVGRMGCHLKDTISGRHKTTGPEMIGAGY